MTPIHRSRQRTTAVMLAVLVLTLAACSQDYPNSTFHTNTEFNAAIDHLWNRLLFLGTLVFVLIEGLLIYAVFRYRRRANSPAPKQVHGNATLEILWTAIPALILVFIAVPTVRTIFQTQAKAAPGSLQVEVIGHQWWWEFRYPELGITTANELYIPVGRTVNFELKTHDVLHSFWIPHLGQARPDLEPHELPLVHCRLEHGDEGAERFLRRVLRRVAREHEVPRVHRVAGAVRVVGGAPADAGRLRGDDAGRR